MRGARGVPEPGGAVRRGPGRRASPTLWRALCTELLQFAAIGLFAVGAVFIGLNVLRRLRELGSFGFSWLDVLRLSGLVAALSATYVLPIAFVFGLMMLAGRLSADGELSALRSLGVGLGGVLAPLLALALGVALATGILLGETSPRALRTLRAFAGQLAASGAMIQPGRFIPLDPDGRRLILVRERDEGNGLAGVVILDESDAARRWAVFAERGAFAFDADTATFRISLEDGDIHRIPDDVDADGHTRIAFHELLYAVDLSEALATDLAGQRPKYLTDGELRAALAADAFADPVQRTRYESELVGRHALAASPIVLAVLGFPLGIAPRRARRSFGTLVAVGLIFAYYVLLTAAEVVAGEGSTPAPLVLWLPNAVFLAVGVALMRRASRPEA